MAKLRSRRAYRSFRAGLTETGLVPARLLPGTAVTLAGAEAAVATALLAGAVLTAAAAPGAAWLAGSALAVAAVLTALLAAGVAVAVRRGTQARCACFGIQAGRPLGRAHVARNLALMAVVWAGLASVPLDRGRAPLGGALLAAAAGVVAALLVTRWDDLAGLFAPIPRSVRRDV